jgi:hypothetical protein
MSVGSRRNSSNAVMASSSAQATNRFMARAPLHLRLVLALRDCHLLGPVAGVAPTPSPPLRRSRQPAGAGEGP